MTVLRERERELRELNAALHDAAEGRGCAVVVEGSAGIGKTRLLQEVRGSALDAGFETLGARATDLEQDFPFSLVRQLFEARLSGLPKGELEVLLEGSSAARGALGLDPRGSSAHDPFAVLHGLYWVTAALADQSPVLLVIDDVHVADAGSLDYLGFLLPRLEEIAVLMVVGARPEEPDPSGGVGRILTDTSVRHLPLAPLSNAASRAVLTQELSVEPDNIFADACSEVTGGNPFLVCELGRSLVEHQIEPTADHVGAMRNLAPERVSRMILTRVGRLSAEAPGVARALSVLGDDSDLVLVAELAGMGTDQAQRAADQLRSVAILEPSLSLRFIHPLVRNSFYADMPAGERARAHARAASLLRSHGASPEQIATQLLASDARGERLTVEALLEAGERALLTGAPRSAIAYLMRSLQEPPPPDLHGAVLEPLLTAGLRAVDDAALGRVQDEMSTAFEHEPRLRIRLAPGLALWMSFGGGRFDEAAEVLQGALEVAEREEDLEGAFRLEVQLKTIDMLASLGASFPRGLRPDPRIDPDSPAGRLAAAVEIPSALQAGTARDAADAARRALGNGGSFFAEQPETWTSGMPLVALAFADEMDAAMLGAEQGVAIALERGATAELMPAWFLRGLVQLGRGDLVSAEADMRQAFDLARLTDLATPVLMTSAAAFLEVLIERDELQAAEAELRKYGVADGPLPGSGFLGAMRLRRGQLHMARGDLDRAAEDFATLPGNLKTGLGPVAISSTIPDVIRVFVAVGEPTSARELCEEMEEAARHWGSPTVIAVALRAGALVREGEDSVPLLSEASSLLERSPNRLQYAHALADLGTTLRRCGRRADSRVPLREAFQAARRCGAVRLANRVSDELKASGESVRRYTPIGVESLTPSERRVAELAASGMTNRQIAQSLFVTVKTVEAHLSAAYDKLDIKSRRQLASALGDEADSG